MNFKGNKVHYFAAFVNLSVTIFTMVVLSRVQLVLTFDQIYVEGIVGGILELPCNVTTPSWDKLAVVLWYREDRADAMYTYDVRNSSGGYREYSLLDSEVRDRVSFKTMPTAKLLIRAALLADQGLYECRVDFMKAPSRTTIIKVVVVDLPESIVIRSSEGHRLKSEVTGNEGSSLSVVCVVEGGTPAPLVWWTLNGEDIDVFSEPESPRVMRNELLLPKLMRSLHLSQLGCFASNSNITRPLSAYVTLSLNLATTEINLIGPSKKLEENHRYRFWCQALGSRPAPLMNWTIIKNNTEPIQLAKQDLRTHNVSKSWVEIQLSWRDDGAILNCTAINVILQQVRSNWTRLNVHYKPRVELKLGARMIPTHSISEGRDIYFQCHIQANPVVYKINWYHNEEVVFHDPQAGVVISNENLVLQRVHRRWAGNFQCFAANALGGTSSEVLPIFIVYPPVCATGQTSLYRVAPGKELTLTCDVAAYPTNVSFSWSLTRNSTQEDRTLMEGVKQSGLRSTISYQPKNARDYGTLECSAANSAGTQQDPCIFKITPAGVPSPPDSCLVRNQTWESLEIWCDKKIDFENDSSDDGVVEADTPLYLLVVREKMSRHPIQNMTGNGPPRQPQPTSPPMRQLSRDQLKYLIFCRETGLFTVSGLTTGIDYTIHVYKYNSHGRSAPVTLEALTLRTAENRMREEDAQSDSAFLGALGGILAVLVVLGLAMLLFIIHIRRAVKTQEDLGDTKDEGGPDLLIAGRTRPKQRPEFIPEAGKSSSSQNIRSNKDRSSTAAFPSRPHGASEQSYMKHYVRADGPRDPDRESFL